MKITQMKIFQSVMNAQTIPGLVEPICSGIIYRVVTPTTAS